ncbi:hypothetical protein L1049_001039 [Liquidambar formosana]|uniref:Laccase n=1 Tax=Liquidambar formosana TaxID=63359 RepID=A0AAP0NDX5_LIQFO
MACSFAWPKLTALTGHHPPTGSPLRHPPPAAAHLPLVPPLFVLPSLRDWVHLVIRFSSMHGVKQPRNPWSDGPEHIAQCPIKSNKNYTQEIVLTDEVGTLWWHAHSDWSRATVHGAIIIKPKGVNYPYRPLPDPDEKTIIIASWYNGNVEDEFEKARNLLGPAPSDAYTINGHAGNCFRDCEANVSVISVESSKTYLLHIVNAVLNEEMFFAIDDHNLTVVAMDGAYVAPITFPYIMLGPGNTMDVLLTTKNESTTNYYMAAGYYHSGGPDPLTLSATALLQYKSDAVMPTCSADFLPTHEDFDKAENFTNSIKSKDPQVVPPMTPGRQYVIEIAAYGPNTFNPPSRSSLSNISYVGKCNDSLEYNATFPHNQSEYGPTLHGNNVILLEYGDVVDIVFQGTSRGAETHPMHVHGYSFFLLGRNYSTFNNNSLINTVNPPVLNTVSVPTNGWAAIRFKADNPGVWFIHCHLERHATWGMATALIVKEGNNVTMQTEPNGHASLC